MSRDALLRLADVAKACSKIVRHVEGQTRDAAFADELVFDGILLNLHVVGEAVKALPDDLKLRHPEVPWRHISGMRDFISHAYFAIDLDIIWDTITRDVPELLGRVREIIDSESRRA